MLYLMTSGCYSDYGIIELLESALTIEEVEKLYKEYKQRRRNYYKRNIAERDKWVLSHPVLHDGTLINVTRVSPPSWLTEPNAELEWRIKDWPLLTRAWDAWNKAHPERDEDRAWLESQGVHAAAYTEIHGEDYPELS